MSRLSPPGWALASMSVVTIVTQLATLYDPSAFMSDFEITSQPAVRLISFLLVLINGYDLLAALQDNWMVYRFSVASRIAAATLFLELWAYVAHACWRRAWNPRSSGGSNVVCEKQQPCQKSEVNEQFAAHKAGTDRPGLTCAPE